MLKTDLFFLKCMMFLILFPIQYTLVHEMKFSRINDKMQVFYVVPVIVISSFRHPCRNVGFEQGDCSRHSCQHCATQLFV